MQSWLGKLMVTHMMRELNAGNIKPTLRMEAGDVELTFPGSNSWSGVIKGKERVRPWLERFVRVGLQIFADEVVVKGFPWRSTICIRGHDHCDGPDGKRVYENRYVMWCEVQWGRMKRYEVYEDTEKAGAFDAWLAEHEQTLRAA
jgi:ketosteroid isomerase-like protein